MATINGDWFHSRSSSHLSELIVVRSLLHESRKLEYQGLVWSGGRQDNPLLYQLANCVGIQPSTMQTKIRVMIRYGFIAEGNACPLMWTRFGTLWDELYSINSISAAKAIYHLTLTISLAIFAFNDSSAQFSINPSNGDMPLKFLLTNLDQQDSISIEDLSILIDGDTDRIGKNLSYWKTDLINSGLFIEADARLYYSGAFPDLVQEIRSFEPNPAYSEYEWVIIRNDPLNELSPFQPAILSTFDGVATALDEDGFEVERFLTESIVETIVQVASPQIAEVDILRDDDRLAQYSRRVRNSTWSARIKELYDYSCVVPACDIIGHPFIESAHIKPNSAPMGETQHRTHLLNGVCLCKNCHSAFEVGLFTLSNQSEVVISNKIQDLDDHTARRAIQNSQSQNIRMRSDNRDPLPEFTEYHREYLFQGE